MCTGEIGQWIEYLLYIVEAWIQLPVPHGSLSIVSWLLPRTEARIACTLLLGVASKQTKKNTCSENDVKPTDLKDVNIMLLLQLLFILKSVKVFLRTKYSKCSIK